MTRLLYVPLLFSVIGFAAFCIVQTVNSNEAGPHPSAAHFKLPTSTALELSGTDDGGEELLGLDEAKAMLAQQWTAPPRHIYSRALIRQPEYKFDLYTSAGFDKSFFLGAVTESGGRETSQMPIAIDRRTHEIYEFVSDHWRLRRKRDVKDLAGLLRLRTN